jgi:AcrR family transcriptional regulator
MRAPNPRPSLRERQRELTRQSIIDATVEAFADKGFAAVTVDDIAARAGIGRATFYLHFNSKADVLRAIRDLHLQDWTALKETGWNASDRDSIRLFFGQLVDFYCTFPVLYKALHEARATDPDFAAAHRESMADDVASLARKGSAPGADDNHLRLAVAMMYTMTDYFMHLWLAQGWELDRELAINAMTDALYATLR